MVLLELLKSSDVGGVFLSWGIFSIQLGNLIVIIAMLVLFALALIVPFPGERRTK
ncbi:MAG TPA: hypothetical protein VIJ18_10710 [Microbacteriaceae bacterium]